MNQQITTNKANKSEHKGGKLTFVRLVLQRQNISLHSRISSKTYIAFLLASAFISILFVNLDLQNIPKEFTFYQIPFLSIFLLFFDQIPLIFIIPFLVASIILVKSAIISSLDQESSEILNLDKRGFNISYLLFDSFFRVWFPILLITSVLATIIGNFVAGIYYFATFKFISFIGYSFPLPFESNYYFWMKGFYFEYFLAVFLVMAIITLITGFIELKRILNEDKNFQPKQGGILYSEVKNLLKEYELSIIIIVDLILISMSIFILIATIQKIDIITILNKWLRYSISINGLALVAILAVIIYLQSLYLRTHKRIMLKRVYFILWLLLDIFIVIELFSIVSHQNTQFMSIVNMIIFGDLKIIIFSILAVLSLMEILSRKIYGFFGLFVLYGIYNSGITDASQNIFLNILVTLGVLLLFFSISSNLINFNMKAGTKLLNPIANLIGENIYLTVPKVISQRSKFVKLSTQIMFLLVLTSIFSSLTFQTAIDINSDEAKWQVGADIRFILSSESRVKTVPTQNIYEIESHPDIISATPVYVNSKWYTDYTHQTLTTSIVFIDIHSFMETAFYRDEWFIGGTATELFEKMQKKPGLIILDETRARLIGKTINDTIVLHTGTDSMVYFTARIVGLAKFFTGNYITDEKGIESFAVMNRQFANPQLQNPSGSYIDDRNPVNYYLLKTKPDSNQFQIGNDLLNDPDIKYLEYGIYHQSLVYSQKNMNVNPVVTQFLGLSSVIGLIATPLAFFVITTSVKEEEKKFYRSMLFDFDENQIKKIITLDLGLSIVTPVILGYSLGIILSIISNQFMPETTLPIVTRAGTFFTLYQIVLILGIILAWLYSSHRRLENITDKEINVSKKENFLFKTLQKMEIVFKNVIPNKKTISFYVESIIMLYIIIGIILTGLRYYYVDEFNLLNNVNIIVFFIIICYFIGISLLKFLLVLHPTKFTVRAIIGMLFQITVFYFLQILEASNGIIIAIIGFYSILLFSLLIDKKLLQKLKTKQLSLLLISGILANIYSFVLIFDESISSMEKMFLEQLVGNVFSNNILSLSFIVIITGIFIKIFLETVEMMTKK